MKNEFVPYDIALALKELGFDEICLGRYSGLKSDFKQFGFFKKPRKFDYSKDSVACLAPLYQQAFRWFREKYNLQHELQSIQKNSWLITIRDTSSTTKHGVYNGKRWDCDDLNENLPHTYEEAELVCLIELIKRAKN